MRGVEINRENIKEALSGGFVSAGSLGEISVINGSHDFNFGLLPAKINDGSIIYD